jgi:serine/threonine protein kinase
MMLQRQNTFLVAGLVSYISNNNACACLYHHMRPLAASSHPHAPQQLHDGGSTSVKTKPQSGGLFQEFKATFGFSSVAQRNKSLQKDFVAEMRLLARLRHPCIISVMGAVVEKVNYVLWMSTRCIYTFHRPRFPNRLLLYSQGQELMLVMELMEHGSLYDLLHNETLVMEPEITLGILRDMVQGIRFLHSNRYVWVMDVGLHEQTGSLAHVYFIFRAFHFPRTKGFVHPP